MKSKFSHLLKTIIFSCLSLLLNYSLKAQDLIIKGRISDSLSMQPITGATVTVKNTSRATLSKANGEFSISAVKGDQLQITFVGYTDKTIEVTGNELLLIQIAPAYMQLNEVVVTALGIRKETKKLGYAVQEVKGEDLVKAREHNPVNSLVGKIAGLTVGASAEMLQGPQLLLRGRGISLFVVDGVPINSDTWNINPDDIETFTVLKGATASALYDFAELMVQ